MPAGTRKSRLDCFVFCASFTTLVYIPHGLVQLLQVASCGLGPAPYIPGQVLRGRAPACGSGLAGPFVLFVFCGGTNLPFGSSGHRSFRILVRCTRTPLVALGTRPSHCQLSFLICCRREVRWVHAATRGAEGVGAPKQAVVAPNGEWELPNLGSRSPQTRGAYKRGGSPQLGALGRGSPPNPASL